MSEGAQFTIGAIANCSDGVCGKVISVVVDPIARALTHLVVEPEHREGLGRLVPLELVDTDGGELHVHCTLAEFAKLPPAEETQFMAGVAGLTDYEPSELLAWPFYALRDVGPLDPDLDSFNPNVGPLNPDIDPNFGVGNAPQAVTYETVPLGEVAISKGEQVHATDGDIGRVQGLVIEPQTHHVTHVLLQEGHLWGRKEVAIPISAVGSVADGIHLNITKKDVADLPPVAIDHPGD